MTKSQSSGEKEGAPDQGRCRCKGKNLRERATCDRGGSSSFWLCVVLREAWGEKGLERATPGITQEHRRTGGKLRTESICRHLARSIGCEEWVWHTEGCPINLHSINIRC